MAGCSGTEVAAEDAKDRQITPCSQALETKYEEDGHGINARTTALPEEKLRLATEMNVSSFCPMLLKLAPLDCKPTLRSTTDKSEACQIVREIRPKSTRKESLRERKVKCPWSGRCICITCQNTASRHCGGLSPQWLRRRSLLFSLRIDRPHLPTLDNQWDGHSNSRVALCRTYE